MGLPNAPKGGLYTTGMTTLTGALLGSGARVPVDGFLDAGASPQSGAIIPGTLPAPAAQLGLVALAGGAKAGATALGYGLNTVLTVATAADSVLLPYAFPGAVVWVRNKAANATQVFGKGTDTINAVATATGVSQAATTMICYIGETGSGDGTDAGNWVRS